MDVKVTHLKQGEDPADVIKKDKEEWKKAIKESKHIVEFSLNILLESIDDKRKLLLKASQTVLPYIARIPNKIDQEHFVSIFSRKLGVSEEVVREELRKVPVDSTVYNEANTSFKTSFELSKSGKKNSIEDKIAGIILWQKSIKTPLIDIETTLKDLERIVGKEKALHITENQDNMEELLFEIERIHANDDEKLEIELSELLKNLEQEYLKEDMQRVSMELKSAEAGDGEDKKIDELIKKHKELSDKLSNINTLK